MTRRFESSQPKRSAKYSVTIILSEGTIPLTADTICLPEISSVMPSAIPLKYGEGRVEGHIRQIDRVVAVAYEVVDTVLTVHVPDQTVVVVKQQLGQGRSPTSATDHGYFAKF